MPNEDLGHKLTDKELAKLERRIAKLYREANSRHGHLKEPAFCGFFLCLKNGTEH